jgi:hypothetical protein
MMVSRKAFVEEKAQKAAAEEAKAAALFEAAFSQFKTANVEKFEAAWLKMLEDGEEELSVFITVAPGFSDLENMAFSRELWQEMLTSCGETATISVLVSFVHKLEVKFFFDSEEESAE